MLDKNQKYKRLPGRRGGVLGYSTLWLGHDHLLGVFSQGFSEEYKRFYFKDIQAIQTRVTLNWLFWSLGLFIFMGLLAWMGFTWLHEGGLVFLILAAVVLLALVYTFYLGPSCRTHIRTAVQFEKLPSLGRIRLYRKAMAQIRPFISEAQGQVRPEDLEQYNSSRPPGPPA